MSAQKGNITTPVLLGALIVAVTAAVFFFWQNQNSRPVPFLPPPPPPMSDVPPPPPSSITGSQTPVPTPTQNPPQTLNLSIPADWQTYNKKFQGLNFRFSYPKGYVVTDFDESSGNIEIKKDESSAPMVEIGKLAPYGFQEYDGGGRRAWFIKAFNNYSQQNTITDQDVIFNLVKFANGNEFYQVSLIYGDPNNNFGLISNPNSKFYFGIFDNKAIIVKASPEISQQDFYRILQALNVKS